MISEKFLKIIEENNFCIGGVLNNLLKRPSFECLFSPCEVSFNDFVPSNVESIILREFVDKYKDSELVVGPIELFEHLFKVHVDTLLKTVIINNCTQDCDALERFEICLNRFKLSFHDESSIPYTTNLTKEMLLYFSKSEIIGRDEVVTNLRIILEQLKKNNVALTGPAGVGKTGVVEKFADDFSDEYTVYELDTMGIISLGEKAPSVLKGLINSLESIGGKNVLFMDEFHILAKSGLADTMKTILNSRTGTLKYIIATTDDEFAKYVKKDKALERRFNPLKISELEGDNLLGALNSWQEKLEQHYGLIASNDLIPFAIEKLKVERQKTSPDKEKDVLDSAFSIVKNTKNADKVTKEDLASVLSNRLSIPVNQLLTNKNEIMKNLASNLKGFIKGQDLAIDDISSVILGNYLAKSDNKPIASFFFAGPTSTGKTEVSKRLAELLMGSRKNLIQYNCADFMESHTISALLGSPDGYVNSDEGGRLYNDLTKMPHCVLLFDEFEKAHPDIQKILLAMLDEGIVTNRRGMVVDITNTLVIFTSNIGGSQGGFTKSNLAAPPKTPVRCKAMGFNLNSIVTETSGKVNTTDVEYDASKEATKKELLKLKKDKLARETDVKSQLLPELVSRIDSIIVFNPLNKESVSQIIESQLVEELEKYQKKQNFKISYSDKVVDFIVKSSGNNPRKGQQAINKYVKSIIAQALVSEKIKPGDSFDIVVFNNYISIAFDEVEN